LSFLSGTFYSIRDLPPGFEAVSRINPFFYMIDGVRGGVLGTSDAHPLLGLAVLILCNLALGALTLRWLHSGYRLKA
ncbi:MAG: ABC transporter permease, partial [Pseudomonadota bacterium]